MKISSQGTYHGVSPVAAFHAGSWTGSANSVNAFGQTTEKSAASEDGAGGNVPVKRLLPRSTENRLVSPPSDGTAPPNWLCPRYRNAVAGSEPNAGTLPPRVLSSTSNRYSLLNPAIDGITPLS